MTLLTMASRNMDDNFANLVSSLPLSGPITEWYTGLSKLFLSIAAPKILLIAGTDRLDQELTVGQMQGKFQMCLLPQAGHVIQEDVRHHFPFQPFIHHSHTHTHTHEHSATFWTQLPKLTLFSACMLLVRGA